MLHFNCVNLKTVTQAEQEGKLFGRLASVLWVLCACQCACLVTLAIRDFAFVLSDYPMCNSFEIFIVEKIISFKSGKSSDCGIQETLSTDKIFVAN